MRKWEFKDGAVSEILETPEGFACYGRYGESLGPITSSSNEQREAIASYLDGTYCIDALGYLIKPADEARFLETFVGTELVPHEGELGMTGNGLNSDGWEHHFFSEPEMAITPTQALKLVRPKIITDPDFVTIPEFTPILRDAAYFDDERGIFVGFEMLPPNDGNGCAQEQLLDIEAQHVMDCIDGVREGKPVDGFGSLEEIAKYVKSWSSDWGKVLSYYKDPSQEITLRFDRPIEVTSGMMDELDLTTEMLKWAAMDNVREYLNDEIEVSRMDMGYCRGIGLDVENEGMAPAIVSFGKGTRYHSAEPGSDGIASLILNDDCLMKLALKFVGSEGGSPDWSHFLILNATEDKILLVNAWSLHKLQEHSAKDLLKFIKDDTAKDVRMAIERCSARFREIYPNEKELTSMAYDYDVYAVYQRDASTVPLCDLRQPRVTEDAQEDKRQAPKRRGR